MPTILPIATRDDPRIAPYLDIRDRDLVRRDGMFVAEGRVVLGMLLASRLCRPLSVLVAEPRLDSLHALLAPLDDDVPVYVAPQPVLDAIAGFAVHRGILAIGQRVAAPTAAELLAPIDSDAATVVLLSAIANHDNIGGIFRNAAAFGISAILLDADCCDPLYRKAIRVSVGAALLVPFARLLRSEDPIALLESHGFAPLALSPAGTNTLAELVPGGRRALVFGAEGPGLADTLLDRVATVRIPMAPGFDSLNVATTSGIVLHHLAGARG